jgi:hypothetical protein
VTASTTVSVISTVPQVQNLTATTNGSSVNLSWSGISGIGDYNIYRSTTSGFTPGPSSYIAAGNVVAYTDSNLSPGTYYYAVIAQNSNGITGPASVQVSATVGGSGTASSSPVQPVACPMVVPYCPTGSHVVVEPDGCSETICNSPIGIEPMPPISIRPLLDENTSASTATDQTAVIVQSFQGILNQLAGILKSL